MLFGTGKQVALQIFDFMDLIIHCRHDEVAKFLCDAGAALVLAEYEAGVRMCKV
jgi:hypothetical protein